MTNEEQKNKCKERARIFQQAMESCKSSSPIDCIEWFADRIAELEKDKQYFSDSLDKQIEATLKLQQENEELDCQKNRNKFCYSCANATERCFKNEIGCPCDKYKSYKDENAELKEKLKPENCLKLLAKEGYIKFTSDNLSKAKEHIKKLLDCLKQDTNDPQTNYYVCQYMDKAEQFISEVEK